MRTEILATIDELNQYLNGNVTDDAALEALNELYIKILKSKLNKAISANFIQNH